MNPRAGSLSEALLNRLDQWNTRGRWLQEQDQWFPRQVFLGIFFWNFPILVLGIGAIGAMFYRADPDPSGFGLFTQMNWMVELTITAFLLAFAIDFLGCLWLRRLWNRRARWIRSMDAQDA